jgi:carboxylesterase type B
MREAGYEANNGLKDQSNAFLWIRKFIGGFGGDPENITFVGESAGSGLFSDIQHL